MATEENDLIDQKSLRAGIWACEAVCEAGSETVMARKMKDSGVNWIGAIPSSWDVGAAKFVVIIRNGSDPRTAGDVPVFGSGLESFKTCGEYKTGPAVLIGRKGSIGIPNYIDEQVKYWNVDTAFDVVATPHFSVRYYFYLAVVFDYNYYVTQTALPSMTQSDYGRMRLPLPPLHEQRMIANYLDSMCSAIEHLMKNIEAQITKLHEYKMSIITQAVTKGLDPNVPMKHSGVGWIGEIPVSWQCCRLKTCLDRPLDYGLNALGEAFDEKLPRYIRITDIDENGNLRGTDKQSLPLKGNERSVLLNGDILFARSGSVGKTFWVNAEAAGALFAGYLIRGRTDPRKLKSRFLYFYTLSGVCEQWRQEALSQATIQNINARKYSNMLITIPPLAEQEAIVSYLDSECAVIASLEADLQARLTNLAGYKKSLILDYATGKKEVPEAFKRKAASV